MLSPMSVALVLTILSAIPASAETIAGRASVIDGDTIEIHGQRIRLWGIDAPEGRQTCTKGGQDWRCGTDAANALDAHLRGATVTCTRKDTDRYRRMVATCQARGEDVGEWLVRSGWALDYRQYSKGAYAGAEAAAHDARSGMWAGEFIPPWEFRRR